MSQDRLFTNGELQEMGARTVDLVEKAIDNGDYTEAKRLAQRMYREFQAMHDLYVDWVTALHSFIYERWGDEVLYESFKAACGAWLEPLVKEVYAGKDATQRARLMIAGLRGHLQPMRIIEDEEKLTILMEPCGSGGRLVLKGRYGPPRNFAKIRKPQVMTYGREDFPIYCAHCPFQEIMPIEYVGSPWAVVFPAERLGEEPCRFIMYKDSNAVPKELYTRVGKEKPKSR